MRKFQLPAGCRCIVDDEGNRITFPSSEISTDDPGIIRLLEKMVKAKNAYEQVAPKPAIPTIQKPA